MLPIQRAREIVRVLFKTIERLTQNPRPALPNPAFNTLAAAVIAGPILFQSLSGALQLAWLGYNPVRDAVSLLVFGPFGWLQTIAFSLFACSLVALAVMLYFHVKSPFKPGLVVLLMLGAAFAVVAANPTGLPGVKDTITALTHRGASIFIVTAFPAACFLVAPTLKARHHATLRSFTIGMGVFALLFLTIGGLVLVNRFSLVGLYERVLLAGGQLWVEFVCAQMLWDRLRGAQSHISQT